MAPPRAACAWLWRVARAGRCGSAGKSEWRSWRAGAWQAGDDLQGVGAAVRAAQVRRRRDGRGRGEHDARFQEQRRAVVTLPRPRVKPSEVTDLVQPLGQHVGKDAPQELHRFEGQLFARAGPVFRVSEGHSGFVVGHD